MGRIRPITVKTLLVSLLATGLLAACASSPIDLTAPELPAGNEGVVFGRIQLIENGKEPGLSFLGESKFGLFVTSEHSAEAVYVPLKDDGSFIWHLPGGKHRIAAFDRRSYGTLSGTLGTSFNVFEGRATYIGTLAIAFSGTRYSIKVVDDYADAAKAVLEKFPALKDGMTSAPMRVEERR